MFNTCKDLESNPSASKLKKKNCGKCRLIPSNRKKIMVAWSWEDGEGREVD